MADGVCDEDLNNELCSYDGGDCCLEFKSTLTCTNDCSCKMSVNHDLLVKDLERGEVMLSADTMAWGNWSENVVATKKMIKDVSSAEVCSLLCMKTSLAGLINAWIFNFLDCSCVWIDMSFLCSLKEAGKLVSFEQFQREADSELQAHLFLKLTASPDCGKEIEIISIK